VEAERVVGVPQHHHAIPQAAVVQGVRDEVHRPGRMPLLAHDHHVSARLDRGPDHVVDEALGEARIPIADLLLLAVVNAAAVARRDPLAPPPVDEPARLVALLAWKVRIPTEIEIGLETKPGQRSREALHTDAEPARLAVSVGTLAR